MGTVNKYRVLIFIERPGQDHEAWTVLPDGIKLVAVNRNGARQPFTFVDNDCKIGDLRFRFIQALPDKEFIAVPWSPEMDKWPNG